MEVDASDYIIGGVLSMECEDGQQRPVDFLSKSLNETEKNYKIHDKKMFVVIEELKVEILEKQKQLRKRMKKQLEQQKR